MFRSDLTWLGTCRLLVCYNPQRDATSRARDTADSAAYADLGYLACLKLDRSIWKGFFGDPNHEPIDHGLDRFSSLLMWFSSLLFPYLYLLHGL